MTSSTVNEVERMVVTRVFDAPRELVWKAWTDPKYIMQWWGPKGFTSPVCKGEVRVGGKLLCCMRTPDGQEFWNAVEYHEIVPHEKIVSLMYFADPEGNRIDPAEMGIEHESIENPWRAQRTAGNSRAGTRYSRRLPRLLRGWRRRDKKLKC
jgi:uncharacterized protein YndB with AHSA1/START domain